MSGGTVIGGRRLTPADLERRTVRHDHAILSVMQSTGLDRVTPADGESSEEYILRLHSKLIASGRTCELLSHFLVPEGAGGKWTPEGARELQAFLEGCNTEEDRAEVLSLAMDCILGFFRRALASLENSLRYSSGVNGHDLEGPSAVQEH